MHKLNAVLLLTVLACSVAMAKNVPVTEPRVNKQFEPDMTTVKWLGERIFANPWLKLPRKWCNSYPSPSRVTTVYGKPIAGDSLTPVDDVGCERPCWVYWKEEGICGVAIERGIFGNTIVSTFVKIGHETVREVIVEKIIERTRTEFVPMPSQIRTVFINTGGYRPPAGIIQIGTTNIHVPSGQTFYGPEENQVFVGFRRRAEPQSCPPEPPDDGTCGPGDDDDVPVEPPPNSGEVNVPPHDPSGQPPGGDPVPPGVGPPPPAPPDNGIITGPDVPPHAPTPDGPHQADPVVPYFQPARLVQPSG